LKRRTVFPFTCPFCSEDIPQIDLAAHIFNCLRNYQLEKNISFAPAPSVVTHIPVDSAPSKKVKKESPLKQLPPCDHPGCPSDKNALNRGFQIISGNSIMVLCKIGHFKELEDLGYVSDRFLNKEAAPDVNFTCFYCDVQGNRVISVAGRNHGYKLVSSLAK
jgi:hypothetical protein